MCPELRVKQVMDGAKWILTHSEETGYLDYKTFRQDYLVEERIFYLKCGVKKGKQMYRQQTSPERRNLRIYELHL